MKLEPGLFSSYIYHSKASLTSQTIINEKIFECYALSSSPAKGSGVRPVHFKRKVWPISLSSPTRPALILILHHLFSFLLCSLTSSFFLTQTNGFTQRLFYNSCYNQSLTKIIHIMYRENKPCRLATSVIIKKNQRMKLEHYNTILKLEHYNTISNLNR